MSILDNKLLFTFIVQELNKKFIDKKHYKYNNEYYLKNIIMVLEKLNNWKSLNLILNNKNNYHYKTIYNVYRKWCNCNFFKNIYEDCLKSFYKNENKNTDLIIDSTFINNLNGSQSIGYNPLYKKKKVSKISVIIDQNNLILSVSMIKPNIHDVKTIEHSLNEIPINLNKKYGKINLIGDKGYITSDNFYLNSKKIKLIVPCRKNMIKKNSDKEKNKLKLRINVEHVINKLKKYSRINLRKDKNIITYMNFLYLTTLTENYKIFNKTKKINSIKIKTKN